MSLGIAIINWWIVESVNAGTKIPTPFLKRTKYYLLMMECKYVVTENHLSNQT